MPDCPSCQWANPQGSRFCNNCGAALSEPANAGARGDYTPRHLVDKVLRHRSAMEGERKLVTVFFADMAGSTRLSEAVDPEQWHLILDQFFTILGEEIHRYEGTINQYTGDGIMALFGAPIAHEDHAIRACHAALALQRRLREFADELRLQRGLNLSARMGLNSGEVVVGRIGDDLRMDYTAQGLTVNLAARMEQIAEPGRVYLTGQTADLLEGYFRLRELGATEVRGSSEPIPVYELIEATASALRLDVSMGRGLTGFIGRKHELVVLDQLLARAREGSGSVALITGDGGIGKSRLCFEALRRWGELDVRILHVSAVPYSSAVPLKPIQDLLRQRFGIRAEDKAELSRSNIAGPLLMADETFREDLPLVFDFLGLTAGQADALNLSPEAYSSRLLEFFGRLCPVMGGRLNVVLVEDLHWIDSASIEFLRLLAEFAPKTAMLLIFNSRPGPRPEWLPTTELTTVELAPLDAAEMARMASELLGPEPGVQQLVPRIAAMASGNPFFIEETVRTLAAHGVLSGTAPDYRLEESPESVDIPPTVHAVVAARIDRLDADDKDLLQLAAVIGRQFDRDLLLAVAGLPDDEFERAIGTLEDGHYLELDGQAEPARLAFCHPLFQEVAYGALLTDRRREIHRGIALELERRVEQPAEPAEIMLMLAHHWHEAGEAVPSARWSLQARAQIAGLDPREEVRLCRQAIADLTPLPDDPAAVPLAISARAALVRSVAFTEVPADEVERAYREARRIAELHDHRLGLAELLVSNGNRLLQIAEAKKSAEYTTEAMALAQELGDTELEARFRVPILFTHFAAGRMREGLALLDRRDQGAWHRAPVAPDNFMSRGFRALMLACLGHIDEALRESEATIEFARRHKRSISWMYGNAVDIDAMIGRTDRALRLARNAVDQAENFGSPTFNALAYRALALALILSERADEGLDLLRSKASLVEAGSVAYQFLPSHLYTLARGELARGQPQAALREANAAIETARRGTTPIWEARARLAAAQAQLELGMPADEQLRQAGGLIESMGTRVFVPQHWHLERAAAELAGDRARADRAAAAAQAAERELGVTTLPSLMPLSVRD